MDLTIGWGSAGFFWVRPVLTAVVRFSRYTRELIEQSGVFTVSALRMPREVVDFYELG